MGRSIKPTAIKKIQGTLQKCRTNPNEPNPPRGSPVAPSHFNAAAKRYWNQICQILDEMGVLTTADFFVLQAFCETLAEQRQARDILKKHGSPTYSVTTREGETSWRKRPEVEIVSDCDKRLATWMMKLGITPADRARVNSVLHGADEVDEFAVLDE